MTPRAHGAYIIKSVSSEQKIPGFRQLINNYADTGKTALVGKNLALIIITDYGRGFFVHNIKRVCLTSTN